MDEQLNLLLEVGRFKIFSFLKNGNLKYLITDLNKIEEYPLVIGRLVAYSNPEALPKTLKNKFKILINHAQH